MEPKTTLAGLGATAIIMGGVEVSVLDEQPIDQINIIANERVEAKQINNEVTASLPWKEERGLNIKYDMGEPTIVEKFKDKRNEQVITEVVDNSQGFKMDIILNKKPANNCFTYQIDGWEDYDFFYQPPLTPEEIAEGAERPEEIVGSYAIYHKTLKNHETSGINYATGKVAHIPYPYVWEVNNEVETKQRAESFDITDGNMTVCAPQSFLDNATYPVRIDPTFGYTSIGADCSAASGFARIANVTSDRSVRIGRTFSGSNVDGTLDSLHMAILQTSTNDAMDLAMFVNIENTSTDSHTQVAEIQRTNVAVTTSAAFYDFTASSEVLSSSNSYIISGLGDGNDLAGANQTALCFDTGGSLNNYFETLTGAASYTTLRDEDPWTETDASETRLFSIYATYTATEEATTTPVTTISGGTVISGGAVIR